MTNNRFNDDELKMIKNVFAENDTLLKLMRKVFLPEYGVDVEIGQAIDVWMNTKVDAMSPEEAITNIKARALFINTVEQGLLMLKTLSGLKSETPEQTAKRLQGNSAK